MRLFLLVSSLAIITATAQAAAVVTCAQPGYSQTVYNGICLASSNTPDTLAFSGSTGASIYKGELILQGLAEVLSVPHFNSGPYPMVASAVWDDYFTLPVSNSTDILKVTVTGGGLNHPAGIIAGPIDYREQDFCDAHYIGNPVCTKTATVSAAQISSIQLYGSDSVSVSSPCLSSNCGFSINADLYELVTVQRFLSDGVTADPFSLVPEPSTFGFLVAGALTCLPFLKQWGAMSGSGFQRRLD